MGAFDAHGRLRHRGALRLLGDAQTPLAERPIKVADRLAAVLLGGRMDESPAPTRLRMVNHPAHDPGRDEAVQMMAALLARPSTLPVVLAGPDADTLLSKACGKQLVAVHVKDISDREVMAEAALVSALEDRPIIFEGLEDIEPADRGRLLRAIESRPERTILAAPTRTAALALGERTVLLVEAREPVLRRARAGLGRPHRLERVRRRRGQVPPLDDPDRRGLRGRPPVGDRARRRAAGARRPRRRRAPGQLEPARRARRAAPARLPVGGPRGARAPEGDAAVDQRLSPSPRPRARATGATRRPSRARRA